MNGSYDAGISGGSVTAPTPSRRSRAYIIPVTLLLLGGLAYGTLMHSTFHGFMHPDEMDIAQLARNISEGRGFTTNYLCPLLLTKPPAEPGHPDLWRGPAVPLLIAAAFRLWGPQDSTATVIAGLSFALLIPLIYLTGTRLFGQRSGLAAAAIALVSPLLLKYATQTMTEETSALLMVLTLYLLFRRAHPAIIGCLAAASYLTHTSFLLVTVMCAIALYRLYDARYRSLVWFAVAFAVAVAPWWARNAMVAGNPFSSKILNYAILMFTSTYPGHSLSYTIHPPELRQAVLSNVLPIAHKAASGVANMLVGIPRLPQNVCVTFLALVGLMSWRRWPRDTRVVLGAFLCWLVLTIPVAAMAQPQLRKYVSTIPVIVMLAGHALVLITQRFRTAFQWAALGAAIMVIAIASVPAIAQTDHAPASYYSQEEVAYITERTAPGELVVTDGTASLAWYGRRTELWAPSTYAELSEVAPCVTYVYFSSGERGQAYREAMIEREYLHNAAFLRDFEIEKRFQTGATVYRRAHVCSEAGRVSGR